MMIPTINGRPILDLIPVEHDLNIGWEHNVAARWRPDRGWCTHRSGDIPAPRPEGSSRS